MFINFPSVQNRRGQKKHIIAGLKEHVIVAALEYWNIGVV